MSDSGKTDGSRSKRNQKMQMSDIKKPGDLCRWYLADPTGRWPICIFVFGILLSLIFMIVAAIEYESAHAIAGVCTLIVCFFGAYHFKTLIPLREQVGEFDKANKAFKAQNAEMLKEIEHLRDAKTALAGQEERLKDVNKHNAENLEKFETIERNLTAMGTSNVEGMGTVLKSMKTLDERLKKQMIAQRRSLYLRVFDEMEFKDDEDGMTLDEYTEFLKCLPVEHRKRLENATTFKELAGDDDIISIDEFSAFLDRLGAEDMASRSTRTTQTTKPNTDDKKTDEAGDGITVQYE